MARGRRPRCRPPRPSPRSAAARAAPRAPSAGEAARLPRPPSVNSRFAKERVGPEAGALHRGLAGAPAPLPHPRRGPGRWVRWAPGAPAEARGGAEVLTHLEGRPPEAVGAGAPQQVGVRNSPIQLLGRAGRVSTDPRVACVESGVSKGTRVSARPLSGRRGYWPPHVPHPWPNVRATARTRCAPRNKQGAHWPGRPRGLPAASSPPGSASRVGLATRTPRGAGETPQPGGFRSPVKEQAKPGRLSPGRGAAGERSEPGMEARAAREGPALAGARRGRGLRGRQN